MILLLVLTRFAPDFPGTADPYVACKLGLHEERTQVAKRTLEPAFGETFVLNVRHGAPTLLRISCADHCRMRTDNPMGDATYDFATLIASGGGEQTASVDLQHVHHWHGAETMRKGSVHIKLAYVPVA